MREKESSCKRTRFSWKLVDRQFVNWNAIQSSSNFDEISPALVEIMQADLKRWYKESFLTKWNEFEISIYTLQIEILGFYRNKAALNVTEKCVNKKRGEGGFVISIKALADSINDHSRALRARDVFIFSYIILNNLLRTQNPFALKHLLITL